MVSFRLRSDSENSARALGRRGVIRGLVLGLFALALCLAGNDPAQAQTSDKLAAPQSHSVLTRDGLRISFTYWASPLGDQAPVVLLLHMQNGNRLDWPSNFTLTLQKSGYAVIAPDLRGHGQSKGGAGSLIGASDLSASATTKSEKTVESEHFKPVDYQLMVTADLEAIKDDFIFKEHQEHRLNMNKMAIVGAEMGANIGAAFATLDWLKRPHPDARLIQDRTPRGQDVRALVLLSPQTSIPGMPITESIKTLKNPALNVAFLVGVGSKDKADRGQARNIYRQLTTPEKNKERMYFQEYDAPFRGTNLLGRRLRTEEHILAFLDQHLKKIDSPWRDRQSRIGRTTE